jgi:hypothetical protein
MKRESGRESDGVATLGFIGELITWMIAMLSR